MYQPHNYPVNCVAYVGTHDNETALGWLEEVSAEDAALAREYLHLDREEGENWGMMRGIWSSPAGYAIVQMQDILGLGREGRINTPSTLGRQLAVESSAGLLWRRPGGAGLQADVSL